MRLRTYITTTFCVLAGIGVMTSPVWFSDWVHPPASATAAQHVDPCKNGYYALTFDDGPFPGYTEKLVATLKRLNVRATFFNVGNRAKRYPELVALERTVGTVEAHSWSHHNYIHMTRGEIERDIERTRQAIGGRVRLSRPPYGGTKSAVRAAIRKAGMVETMWTVDTEDWKAPHTHRKVIRLAMAVQEGGVILMHDGWPYIIYTLPEVIQKLQDRHMCAGKLYASTQPSLMPGRLGRPYDAYPFHVRAGTP